MSNSNYKFILKSALGVALLSFLFGWTLTHSALALESFVRVPCGAGFLRDCDWKDRGGKTTDLEQPVVPKLIKAVKANIKTAGSFHYNDGSDVNGNKVLFNEGKIVDLFTGDTASFGTPVCSRCRTTFNKYNKELKQNYKGEGCGNTTTVEVTTDGNYITFGQEAFAWHRGIYTMIFHYYLKTILNEIQKNKTLTYSPSCKSFAAQIDRLTQENTGKIKQLADLLGTKGAKESLMSEKDFDRLASNPENADTRRPGVGDSPQVDRNTAAERPDQGRLRQLAQHIKSSIESTETAFAHLAVCTVADRTAIDFRTKYGSFFEFFNQSVVDQISDRIEAKVARECGSCSTMGSCLSCSNRVANRVAPGEVEYFFDVKIAPYCDDQSSSADEASLEPSLINRKTDSLIALAPAEAVVAQFRAKGRK